MWLWQSTCINNEIIESVGWLVYIFAARFAASRSLMLESATTSCVCFISATNPKLMNIDDIQITPTFLWFLTIWWRIWRRIWRRTYKGRLCGCFKLKSTTISKKMKTMMMRQINIQKPKKTIIWVKMLPMWIIKDNEWQTKDRPAGRQTNKRQDKSCGL